MPKNHKAIQIKKLQIQQITPYKPLTSPKAESENPQPENLVEILFSKSELDDDLKLILERWPKLNVYAGLPEYDYPCKLPTNLVVYNLPFVLLLIEKSMMPDFGGLKVSIFGFF